MTFEKFRNRIDAARKLAEKLKPLELHDPLVLGIPRGGVVTAAELARELDAELDVALARKLGHPLQPELAVGALSEDGEVYLNEEVVHDVSEEDLQREQQRCLAELKRRRALFREIRPAAPMEGRSVIITDDGIATGATMFAALKIVKQHHPQEVIVAVPVAPPRRLEELRTQCDRVICLAAPDSFMAIGEFYEDFDQVSDEEACDLLRQFAPTT